MAAPFTYLDTFNASCLCLLTSLVQRRVNMTLTPQANRVISEPVMNAFGLWEEERHLMKSHKRQKICRG